MLYEDNPHANLQFLKGLSRKELTLYLEGYLMACAHVKESLTLGSTEILNKLIDGTDSIDKELLETLLNTHDFYRDLLEEKEKKLYKVFPSLEKSKKSRQSKEPQS